MNQLESPSRKLATLVVNRLVGAGLLRADRQETLVAKIAAGEMKSDDWKLEIDLAAAKTAKP
jgi:hypothetical protein